MCLGWGWVRAGGLEGAACTSAGGAGDHKRGKRGPCLPASLRTCTRTIPTRTNPPQGGGARARVARNTSALGAPREVAAAARASSLVCASCARAHARRLARSGLFLRLVELGAARVVLVVSLLERLVRRRRKRKQLRSSACRAMGAAAASIGRAARARLSVVASPFSFSQRRSIVKRPTHQHNDQT